MRLKGTKKNLRRHYIAVSIVEFQTFLFKKQEIQKKKYLLVHLFSGEDLQKNSAKLKKGDFNVQHLILKCFDQKYYVIRNPG